MIHVKRTENERFPISIKFNGNNIYLIEDAAKELHNKLGEVVSPDVVGEVTT